MSKTLKSETIRTLKQEGTFQMATFGWLKDLFKKNRNSKNYCGTPSCLAGHIVSAGARMGRNVPKELTKEPTYNAMTNSYDSDEGADLMRRLGLKDDNNMHPVARTARYLWARSYGKTSANKLDFYGEFAPNMDLDEVTPEQAIEHLNSI